MDGWEWTGWEQLREWTGRDGKLREWEWTGWVQLVFRNLESFSLANGGVDAGGLLERVLVRVQKEVARRGVKRAPPSGAMGRGDGEAQR